MIHYLFNPNNLPEHFGIQELIKALQQQGISGSDRLDFIQSIKTAINVGELPASRSETDDTSVHFLQSVKSFSWEDDGNQISFCKRHFSHWLQIRGLKQQKLLLQKRNRDLKNIPYDNDGVEAIVSERLLVLGLVYYHKWDGIGLSDTHPSREKVCRELRKSMLFSERILRLLPTVIKPLWACEDKVSFWSGRDQQAQWEYEQANPSIWHVVDILKKVHLQFWSDRTKSVNSGVVETELIKIFTKDRFSDSVTEILASLIRPNWDT